MNITRNFALLLLLIPFASCKKDKNNDNPKSKTELLTSRPWVYDEYFTNYNSASTTLAYKKGKSNNSTNLSANTITFHSDGTVSEINQNGQTVNGTWKFTNNETTTQTINQVGTFNSQIVSLSEDSYIWYDPATLGGIYAKMVHP
jgi:C-terminal lipocalin-like domain